MMLKAGSNPFVGLRAYESHESILFFGRNDQTIEVLQKLHQYRFLAVIGSSGSGKSSLVKAGMIPRLKAGYLVNRQSGWAIATMKPGQDALLGFSEALLNLFDDEKKKLSPVELKRNIQEQGSEAILRLGYSLQKEQMNFLLLVDQFEELFRYSLHKSEIEQKDESADFVNLLMELSEQKKLSFYITITMRSDFIGDCSQFFGLPEAINKGLYLVPRLTRTQLEIVVEGPVRLFSREISPLLTTRLLNDAQMIEDALPLLQHALMRTWNYEMTVDKNGELDVQDYKQVGCIERALSIHADEVLQGLSEEELDITKKMFQALTATDQNGRKIRRPVLLNDLVLITGADKEKLRHIISRFTGGNTSFLITSKVEDDTDLLIDISHESLIRQWELLNEWVEREADAAKIFLRLTEAEKLYKEKNKNLLSGNELHQFRQWYRAFKPGYEWAQRYSRSFTDAIAYLQESDIAETKRLATKQRNRNILIGSVSLVVLMIILFSVKIYFDDINSKNQLALNYWTSSQDEAGENNKLEALQLIAEAVQVSTRNDVVKDLLINAESDLPSAALTGIYENNNTINSVTFSPDEKLILAADQNGRAFIIDKATGKKIKEFSSDSLPVVSAAFSPDQKLVLTAGNDSTARLWKIADGSQVAVLKHPQAVTNAVFSVYGHSVITSCADSCVRIWSDEKQVYIAKLNTPVNDAVISRDNTKLLISGNDSTARLWSIITGKVIYTFHHKAATVTSAVFSHDETQVLTTGDDSTARIWDAATGVLIDSFHHNSEVTNGTFSPDGKWIATCTRGKNVHLWSLENSAAKSFVIRHATAVYDAGFSANSQYLITAGSDKAVHLWQLAEAAGNDIQTFRTAGVVTSAVFSNDNRLALTCGFDSVARLWNVSTGKPVRSFSEGNVITKGVFSLDDKYVLTCGYDSAARLWNIATGKQQAVFRHNGIVRSVVCNADNKTILTTGDDSTIRMWTLGAKQEKIITWKDKVQSGVLSPDGSMLLITSSANTAYLLNSGTGEELQSFRQDDVIKSAVFSPDGQWILTAGWDNTARLWNVATGMQDGAAMEHNKYVWSAVFSPDGKRILTAGWDSCVRIWDAATKKQITTLVQRSPVNTAMISRDQTTVLIASRDSIASLVSLPGDLDIPASLFKRQAQALTGTTYDTRTSEVAWMSSAQWQAVSKDYEREAKAHYAKCRYKKYNVWHRLRRN